MPRLEVKRFEHIRLDQPQPHAHSFYTLLVFESGRGEHRLAGRAFSVAAGDVLLIAPGETYDLSKLEQPQGFMVVFELDALGFSGEVLTQMPDELMLLSFVRPQGLDVGHIRLTPSQLEVWLRHLITIEHELAQRPLGFSEAARALLTLLLIEAARLTSAQLEQVSVPSRPLLKRAFRFIEKHFREPISLIEVARAVERSSAYLTDVMRRETGRTVLEWIIERRLSEARRLLIETEDRIEDIAHALGYSDTTYFARQFRQRNGTTPQAWRRAQQKT
jgi:AraC-like DNA-binding protein